MTHFEVTEISLALRSQHAFGNLHVAHLSDVHVGSETAVDRIVEAVREVNRRAPELVLLTGDFVTSKRDPVEQIAQLLGRLQAPAYAVLGNHDHDAGADRVQRALEMAGIEVLRNQNTIATVRGQRICLLGVDDIVSGNDDVAQTFRGAPGDCPRLVLSHGPMIVRKLPINSGLACFAGHTHGGQMLVPAITRAICYLAGQHYIRGAYHVGGNWLYVNRGLGYGDGWIRRWNAVPEIAVMKIGQVVTLPTSEEASDVAWAA